MPQAWGVRLVFFGVMLVMLAIAFSNASEFPGKLAAEKFVATGDIFVMDKSDDRSEAAFARALTSQGVEAGMNYKKSDWQSRRYDVWLIAPTRDIALAKLDALLKDFQREFGGDPIKDVTTFSSSYVLPLKTPKVLWWNHAMNTAVLTLTGVGLAMVAGGCWVLWKAVKGDKRQFASLIFQNDDPAIDPPVFDEGDDASTDEKK